VRVTAYASEFEPQGIHLDPEVMRVPTYEDAVRLVNDNPYGNGTAIFRRDGGAARQFQFEAQVGMVGINVPIPVPVAYRSFGGWKNSLFGGSIGHCQAGHLHAVDQRDLRLIATGTPDEDAAWGPEPYMRPETGSHLLLIQSPKSWDAALATTEFHLTPSRNEPQGLA